MTKRVFAIAAHPDDIEFMMAGTLILLKHAGYEIHYMNVSSGNCGSVIHTTEEIIKIRRDESINASAFIGAIYHESLTNDLEIFYEKTLLMKLGAIIREVAPDIILLQSPNDYMEDHQNTARLAVTAAFARGMKNYITDPLTEPIEKEVTIYHAQPFGNRDGMGQIVLPDIFVNISEVMELKRQMLSLHQSQKQFLDKTQGLGSYIIEMENICRETGSLSGCYEYAEGWRRHYHLGFCQKDSNPLTDSLSANTSHKKSM